MASENKLTRHYCEHSKATRFFPNVRLSRLPRSLRGFAMTCLIATNSSCSLAPDYHRPDMPLPASYKENKDWKQAEPSDYQPRGNWWEVFGNKELDDLEVRASNANQDVKVTFARYQEARAAASFARADYFPTVTATAIGERTGNSTTTANARPVRTYNDYSAEGDLSYELDLWGRIRSNVTAANATAESSKADLATARLSLAAELAIDYFALRADDASQNILDDTVTAYEKAQDLTSNRFKGGVASQIDVDQAQVQLQNARTQAADMRMKRAQLEHAIAVLVGEQPSRFSLRTGALDAKLPPVNAGIPSALLERRPDIASAERLAKAANYRIGVARAAWFPTINLLGSFGYESANTGNLFSAPSQLWMLGPSAFFGMFDAGRISALNRQAHAQYDEAAASYRGTVLNAYREVEDSIIAIHQLHQEMLTQTEATKAAERVLAQEQDRYTGGIVNYLDVVIAQNTELQAKLAFIDIETRELTATIQLIKALGGGWQVEAKDSK